MVVKTQIVVRSTELDSFGHVNNARYLEYFEWGRFDWSEACGVSWSFGEGLTAVIANVNVNYRREARLGEALTLSTSLVARGSRSFRFAQALVNARGERVADAEITAVVFDVKKRKSASLPADAAARLDALVVS